MPTGFEKASLPMGNAYIGRTTPLHVAQLVLLILKEAFLELEEGHPFRFTEDFNTTRILFDTVFNKDSEAYGKKPAIIVSRGPINTTPLSMGDLAMKDVTTGNSMRSSMIQSSVGIKVIARESMSADILAQDTFAILMTTRTALPILTNVHSVTSLNVSPVNKYEENDALYFAEVTMSFVMQNMWTWEFEPTLLNSISLKFNEDTDLYKQVLCLS